MLLSERVLAFAELGRLCQELNFAESIAVTDPEVLREVRSLLAQEVGVLQRVFDLTIDPDSDTFKGKAEQRLSLSKSQIYGFTIDRDRMVYKLIEPSANFGESDEDWLEIAEFYVRSGKTLNCKPGNIQCGGRCQNGKKNCYHGLTPEQKRMVRSSLRKARAVAGTTQPAPTPKPGSVADLNPGDIVADPKRFQYKVVGALTKTGEVGSLSGVQKYDPNLAGIVQVWLDPADGKTYVVNGHNRLALAKRLGAEQVTVRYLDVKDPQEARAVGALTNIAEGRGDALDAGKFFRDSGITREELAAKGIPMREKISQDGLALSGLDDGLFRKAIDGDIPIERAVIIGKSGLSHDQQRSLVDLVDKAQTRGRRITNDVIQELADTVKASTQSTSTQFDLFGSSDVQINNALERASLISSFRQRLSREQRLFSTVGKSKAAEDLARAGNLIDVERSQQIGREAAGVLAIFDQLKNVSGEVGDRINEAATRIQNGENPKKVQDDIYKRLVDELPAIVGGKK
ncbi:hypothetical protein HY772_05595 [Candidatus Woesearchaeota archaeon]|nr:hypothetical protein [Candidatus Woesearchaeota archaeon]